MKTIMAKPPQYPLSSANEQDAVEETLNSGSSSKTEEKLKPTKSQFLNLPMQKRSNSTSSVTGKKPSAMALSKFCTAFSLGRDRAHFPSGLGPKVVGTLFGYRRGRVRFAFQGDFKASPAFLVELETPTGVLVKEMASGVVRIALECDKKKGFKILKEPIWRTYCNGKKCGYAMRKECGVEEWTVLNAISHISMGAGVLPGAEETDGEMMYMRAKFERVVGSRDSEAFYMMNPAAANGGHELSVYLLRV